MEIIQFDKHIFQMGWFNHQLTMAPFPLWLNHASCFLPDWRTLTGSTLHRFGGTWELGFKSWCGSQSSLGEGLGVAVEEMVVEVLYGYPRAKKRWQWKNNTIFNREIHPLKWLLMCLGMRTWRWWLHIYLLMFTPTKRGRWTPFDKYVWKGLRRHATMETSISTSWKFTNGFQNDALSKVSLFKRGDFGYLYLHQPVSLRILNPKLWKHRTLVMIPRKGHQNQQWSWHPTTSQGFLGFAMLLYRYMDGSYSNGIRFCNALQISGFDSNIFILRETIQLDQHMFQLGGSTVELLFAWFFYREQPWEMVRKKMRNQVQHW